MRSFYIKIIAITSQTPQATKISALITFCVRLLFQMTKKIAFSQFFPLSAESRKLCYIKHCVARFYITLSAITRSRIVVICPMRGLVCRSPRQRKWNYLLNLCSLGACNSMRDPGESARAGHGRSPRGAVPPCTFGLSQHRRTDRRVCGICAR